MAPITLTYDPILSRYYEPHPENIEKEVDFFGRNSLITKAKEIISKKKHTSEETFWLLPTLLLQNLATERDS